ncbi:hypothetical protein SAMN05446934_1900 [Paraburkholderia hospita]|nr:hypothetical protein PMI06_009942 [Burkholderia sp. BT03]SKC46310.1 hypothetical protein SAMN06266956_0094 [Paraburkholderia hospita]SKC69230.1 hypothetical protein SAMN05446934_1900 [Paraburkholderia hospita]
MAMVGVLEATRMALRLPARPTTETVSSRVAMPGKMEDTTSAYAKFPKAPVQVGV